jgi:hypothetical protein
MTPNSSESGMDELRRLSRQTASLGKQMLEEEQRKAEHTRNMHGVVLGLRGISYSVALNQLKPVATPEIYEKVRAMQNQADLKELRGLISDISRNLERITAKAARDNQELEPLANSVKTLSILISLLFSLH